jgi:hypothetical protein
VKATYFEIMSVINHQALSRGEKVTPLPLLHIVRSNSVVRWCIVCSVAKRETSRLWREEWGGVSDAGDDDDHFGGRFCHVSSRSCVFTSSLKWSKVEGPVPVYHEYGDMAEESVANVLPPPFFASMSGSLLILRYTLWTALLNAGLRMS